MKLYTSWTLFGVRSPAVRDAPISEFRPPPSQSHTSFPQDEIFSLFSVKAEKKDQIFYKPVKDGSRILVLFPLGSFDEGKPEAGDQKPMGGALKDQSDQWICC